LPYTIFHDAALECHTRRLLLTKLSVSLQFFKVSPQNEERLSKIRKGFGSVSKARRRIELDTILRKTFGE